MVLIRPLLVSLYLLLPVIAVAGEFNLDSLLLLSVGGEEGYRTVSNMTSFRATGEILLNGQRGRFVELVAPPNKIYLSLTFPQYDLTQAYDGQVGWQADLNGRISQVSGFEEAELIKTLYLESFSHLVPGRMPGDAAYIKDTIADGAAYHVVEFYPFLRDTLRVLYRKGSGDRAVLLSQMDNVQTITSLDQFESVDGVPVPMHQAAVAIGVPLTVEMTVDTAQFNQPFEPGLFSRPGSELQLLPDGVDSLVIPFDYRNGHIFVLGTINGKKRVRFILDSGASATIFDSSAVDNLDLPLVGTMPARGVAGYVEAKLVRSDSVDIGGVVLRGQIGGKADLRLLGIEEWDAIPFAGVIGYDFLSRHPLAIDHAAGHLVVYSAATFVPPAESFAIPFELTMLVPTVKVSLGEGQEGRFLVDLGNALGLILHEPFAHRLGLDSLTGREQYDQRRVGGIGGGVGSRQIHLATVSIGGLRLHDLPAVVTSASSGITGSLEIDGNIGNQLLGSYRVLFDYQHQLLYLLPAKR